jgi:predicted small lipoprotein YifL
MIRSLVILSLIAALGVSACGKRGPLGPPPSETEQENN